MKVIIKMIVSLSLLAVLAGVLGACTNSQAAAPATQSIANLSPAPPKVFEISNLVINPSKVNAGVQVFIAAKVTNTSDADESYQPNVRLDNTTQSVLPAFLPSDKVKIPKGSPQVLRVTTTINNPGTYNVTWDGVSQKLVVNQVETLTQSKVQNTAPITAPDFTATAVVTGKTVSLSQYSGSGILLNFVNYGCDPATSQKVSAQLLAIKQLQSQRTDFMPISVFCGCCPLDVLRKFAKDNNLNWPWILDNDYSIASKYQDSLRKFGYPTLIFIDKNQVISEVTGYTNLSNLTEKINKIAADQIK